MPHLFLDCDGVLADFDAGARAVLGMPPDRFTQKHGIKEFWRLPLHSTGSNVFDTRVRRCEKRKTEVREQCMAVVVYHDVSLPTL